MFAWSVYSPPTISKIILHHPDFCFILYLGLVAIKVKTNLNKQFFSKKYAIKLSYACVAVVQHNANGQPFQSQALLSLL